MNCLNVFGHFVGLALKGLKKSYVFFSMRLFIENFRNIEIFPLINTLGAD